MSSRAKQKKKSHQHQLHDSVSFADKSSLVPPALREKYKAFVVDLADRERERTSAFTTSREWSDYVLKLRKVHKVHPRKTQMKKVYLECLADGTIIDSNLALEQYLQTRQSRALSGVLVIATLMAPYPVYLDRKTGKMKQQRFSCAHNCYYCPNQPGMPRSYLSSEPAVSRALRADFDAIDQFYARAHTLQKLGHEIDKIELLVLGGTFCQFPIEYQEQFIRDLFWSANTFYDGICDFQLKRPRKSLFEEIKIHETATKCRIIGLTFETRPDTIKDFETIARFRSYGATRLQIGIQHTDDEILQFINRGCSNSDTIRAVRLLKNCGYKIDIHLMPNLPGSTVEKDYKMFNNLLSDELIQCDAWKVYPCQTVDYTLIQKWYEKGQYKPYSFEELMRIIIDLKSKIHPWIRLNRIFRSLPKQHITSGITLTNFRQHMYHKMEEKGLKCKCIRCREIGTHIRRKNQAQVACKLQKQKIVLKKRQYKSSGGDEIFISLESEDETILMGFVRLRLPPIYIKPCDREKVGLNADESFLNNDECDREEEFTDLISQFPELYQAALIREAHVYGAKQSINKSGCGSKRNAIRETFKLTGQSRGYGTKLIEEAEKIALSNGYSRVAVIAGVGTRLFYRLKLGYKSAGTYMVKDFVESGIGRQAKGSVNTINVSVLKSGFVTSACVCCGLYILSSFLSILFSLCLCLLTIGYFDYLHFYKIKHNMKKTNVSLLRLSRVGLILINLSIIFKCFSAFMPQHIGHCYCRTYWSSALVSYVASFYILKLLYHKRVIIMLQNPLFGGKSSIPYSMAALLIAQLLAFSLCEFLVINYVFSSKCTDDKFESPFKLCHDNIFESITTWIAIFAIVFDAGLFSLFCSKWYSIMFMFMEEMATSLLAQFSLVIMAILSCVIDAILHMILLCSNNDEDTFDACLLGTPSFCLNCCIMAACLVLSFTDAQIYCMKQIGVDDLKPYYQQLENLGYTLHIM